MGRGLEGGPGGFWGGRVPSGPIWGVVGWVGGGGMLLGQALVNHKHLFMPYVKPYHHPKPASNIGWELMGEGTSSRRFQRQMRYALESG